MRKGTIVIAGKDVERYSSLKAGREYKVVSRVDGDNGDVITLEDAHGKQQIAMAKHVSSKTESTIEGESKMYKSGDKLIAQAGVERYSKLREGEIVTYKGIDRDGDLIVETGAGYNQYIKPGHLRKFDDDAKPFAIGEKVRVQARYYHKFDEGDIGEVIGYHKDSEGYAHVQVGDDKQYVAFVDLTTASDTREKEASSDSSRDFKVGDFVRGNGLAGAEYTYTGEGAVVKVTSIIDRKHIEVEVTFEHPLTGSPVTKRFPVLRAAFDKASETEAKRAAKGLPTIPQVGDSVRVVDEDIIDYADEFLVAKPQYPVVDTFGEGGIVILDDEGDRFVILPKELKGLEVVGEATEPEATVTIEVSPTLSEEAVVQYLATLEPAQATAILADAMTLRAENAEEDEAPSEAPKAPKSIEVGDRVRLITKAPRYGFGHASTGDVGTVEGIERDGSLRVNFGKTPWASIGWHGIPSEFELVSEEEKTITEIEQKLKVGAKVKVITHNPSHGLGEVEVGEIGEIVRVDSETDFVANFPNHDHWYGELDDIEIVG